MTDCNIVSALYQAAQRQGEEIALTALEEGSWRQWSFEQVAETSRGYAGALYTRGVRRGDRVMLMVRPSMEFVCLTFGLFQLGAVIILIDPGMGYKKSAALHWLGKARHIGGDFQGDTFQPPLSWPLCFGAQAYSGGEGGDFCP